MNNKGFILILVVVLSLMIVNTLNIYYNHKEKTSTIEKEHFNTSEYLHISKNREVHEILCERNGVQKGFLIVISANLDNYEREFTFRSACSHFTNKGELWND